MSRKPGELKVLEPVVRVKLMAVGLAILAVLTTVSLSVGEHIGLRGTIDIARSDITP
jgi:ABC-type xylose transport system permease subunit